MSKRILVCGASGFVGRHLLQALDVAGYDCYRGVRKARGDKDVVVDYSKDVSAECWLGRVSGFDVVINAVGVLRDTRRSPMQLLHADTPAALFSACQQAGVESIINISALGVGSALETVYFSSKAQAEQQLFSLPETVRWLNIRPSVVYGEDGASAGMFRLLARLPVHVLPMGGHQQMQPVHIDDICAAVLNWLAIDAGSQSVTASGADVVSMREMLDSYRHQLGYGSALHIPMPGILVTLAAKCGDLLPASALCSETLQMLQAGNTGDNSAFCSLLGRPVRSVHQFMGRQPARA